MDTALTNHKPRFFTIVALLGLFLILAAALIGLKPRGRKLSLNNGNAIRITLAPFLTSLVKESSAKVIYEPRDGPAGTVIFLQDSDSQPAMIIPASDGRTFFCLYYADVVYRLVKVHPSEKMRPFPKNSYLSYIIISSSCAVESGTTNDWHAVSSYINTVSDDVFKQEAFGFPKAALSSGVSEHIWNMEHGFID